MAIKPPLVMGVTLMFLVSVAHAQQGGGIGGLAGGGRAGVVTDAGETTIHTHILTPGDRGEWPLNAKAGDVVIANAQSEVFDPAIEVVDSTGKVVAQNDDIETGQQQAQVLYRFPRDGAYKLLVKGFKSAAGGQYTLTLRRFHANDAKIGERNAARVGRNGVTWLRFPAKKGQTLLLAARMSTNLQSARIFLPDGQVLEGHSLAITERGVRGSFPTQEGDHYLRLDTPSSDASYAVTISTAFEAKTAIGAPAVKRDLPAGGLDLWSFEGRAGELIKVQSSGPITATIRRRGGSGPESEEETAGWLQPLRTEAKALGVRGALLLQEGTYEVSVTQAIDLPASYTLTLVPMGKTWTGAEVSDRLTVGHSDYWVLDGRQGEIVQFDGASDQFDLVLDLLNARGQRIAFNDDGAERKNPRMTVLLPQSGRYIVRAHSQGDGGGGSYILKRAPAPVKTLAIGDAQQGRVGQDDTQIWTFQAKANQALAISVRSTELSCSMRIFGPDGVEVAADYSGDGSVLGVLRVPLDGSYTVWVSGTGSGTYRIKCFDLDQ